MAVDSPLRMPHTVKCENSRRISFSESYKMIARIGVLGIEDEWERLRQSISTDKLTKEFGSSLVHSRESLLAALS